MRAHCRILRRLNGGPEDVRCITSLGSTEYLRTKEEWAFCYAASWLLEQLKKQNWSMAVKWGEIEGNLWQTSDLIVYAVKTLGYLSIKRYFIH